MFYITVGNLGLFYNVVTEKIVAQQEIQVFKKEKVGLDLIPRKILKLVFQFNNCLFFLFLIRAQISIGFTANADGTKDSSLLKVKQKTSLF